MNTRRDRWEIIGQILSLCRTPRKKTWIIYKCNLNFKTFDRYWATIEDHRFGKIEGEQNGDRLYITTKRGLAFLSRWEKSLGQSFEALAPQMTIRE